MMVIDVIMLVGMGAVVRKVYKIDRFKNKFIFSLILSIILSLLCDFADWLTLCVRTIYENDGDTHFDEFMHNINTSLDVAAAYFMTVGLKLNLRIWIVYYLKIVFMGQINLKTDSEPNQILRLNNLIRVIDIALISLIVG